MTTKKLRTNKDFMGALLRRSVQSVKVSESLPEEVQELANHVKESVEEKFEESDAEEVQNGTIEAEGEEVKD